MVKDMLRIGVIVNKGFEKVAVTQIREFIDKPKSVEVDDTFVTFDASTWDEVYRFVYMNQIGFRVLYSLGKIEFADDDLLSKTKAKFIAMQADLGKNVNEADDEDEAVDEELLTSLIRGGADFRVSIKSDEHSDMSWLESEIGGILIEHAKVLGHELKVNLKNPSLNLYIQIHNSVAHIGIDLSGDLSKRDYKIFNNAVSLKGPTAFGLLMIAGYQPKDVIVNPYCYSGTLEIEAALYATRTSHRYYNKDFPFMKFPFNVDFDWDKLFKKIDAERVADKGKISITGSDKLLSSITASVKNAKIAGVESFLNFRRIDLDWVDIKYEEKSVDKMISFIQGSSKRDKDLAKEFKQNFYQAEYILKDKGTVVIMCLVKELLIESSKEYFNLDKEVTVYSSNQPMHILFFKKK